MAPALVERAMSAKKVPNNVKGSHTGLKTVDSQIVRWRNENRRLGRTIGPATERGKRIAKEQREARAQPATKKRFFE